MKNIIYFKLQFQKHNQPCDYKTAEILRSFDGFTTPHNNSQITKRLSMEKANEMILLLKSGETVELN